MKREKINRFMILMMIAAVSLLFVEAQLLNLQVLEHDFWSLEAQKNRTRARSLPFKRGWILDRNQSPVALTRTLFELRFVFRHYRLNSPVGHISMIYFLLNDERIRCIEIYDEPAPFIEGVLHMTPAAILEQSDRWKLRDLKTYVKWLFELNDEVEEALFESEEFRNVPFVRIPLMVQRLDLLVDKIVREREALELLEIDSGVDRGTFLNWPDRAAQRSDYIVNKRMEADMNEDETAPGEVSYARLRKYYREVDSYENNVHRSITHESTLKITLSHDLYPGFYVVESTQRFYPKETEDCCPMLIGRTGLPSSDELSQLKEHRRRLEELSLLEEKTIEQLIEEESLRLQIQEIDILPEEEVGRLGLEAGLEPALRGKRGFILEERGPRTRRPKVLEYVPPIHGKDVVLTLDLPLQRQCEIVLDNCGFTGAAVIMDVHTGAVIAMATSPQPRREQLSRDWTELLADKDNPLMFRPVYNKNLPPPGSVFKLVTAIAALEEGICTTDEPFECTKRISVGRTNLHCEGLHGPIAMEDAIVKSCNIYFYRVGSLLGYEKLFDWAERFGFGQRTGYLDRSLYGLEGSYRGFPEADGKLKRHERGEANLMRLAIGQGAIDDVTPLQVARMAAAMATGRLPQPHLISRIGDTPFVPPEPEDLGISESYLAFVQQSMKEVVTRGTAEADPAFKRDLEPFKVAGKTGTPQVGGSHPTHACFAGYFPWNAPRWSFAVFIEKCDLHGGEIAAPVLNRILETEEAKILFEEGDR